MSTTPNSSACPVCGHSDQSQPIEAIVASQTTHTSNYGTSIGMGFANGHVVPVTASHRSSSTAQSPLAQMLDLPYPQPPRNKAGCGVLLIALMLCMSAAFIMATISILRTDDHANPLAQVIVLIIFLIMFSPVLIIGISLIKQHRRERRMWSQRIDLWRQARQVWITLRYCHRDHVVYRWPNVTISPTMVQQFTYDQIASQPAVKGPQRA